MSAEMEFGDSTQRASLELQRMMLPGLLDVLRTITFDQACIPSTFPSAENDTLGKLKAFVLYTLDRTPNYHLDAQEALEAGLVQHPLFPSLHQLNGIIQDNNSHHDNQRLARLARYFSPILEARAKIQPEQTS